MARLNRRRGSANRTFYGSFARVRADAARAEQADAVHVQLTPRERQVATLLAYGYTNVEIANRLTISVRTAEMHRANAMRKLAAERRADVVRWALDHQLLR